MKTLSFELSLMVAAMTTLAACDFGEPCLGACNGTNVTSASDSADDTGIDARCSLPPVSGPCEAFFPRFYYDAEAGTCRQFIYGGCQGNANNFSTHTECFTMCGGDPVPVPVAAVVESMTCDGAGLEISAAGDESTFSREGDVITKELTWGCGCPDAPEFVLAYTPTSPLTLRLCHDDAADPCEAGCIQPVSFDLAPALRAAGATDFVFVDP